MFLWKEVNILAEKATKATKSKTDVSSRAAAKGRAAVCRNCGNTVDVVMAVTPTGKKRMRRNCCEAAK